MTDRLVLIPHDGSIGGVLVLYSLVARQAIARGMDVTVIATDGPGHEIVDWGGASLILGDRFDGAMVDRAAAECAGDCMVVMSVGPETACLMPAIAAAPRCAVTSLGSKDVMRQWLGPARVAIFTEALREFPHIMVGIPGVNFLEDAREVFGVAAERCFWFTHCIEPVDGNVLPQADRDTDQVLAPGRLSVERRPFITTAADLAAERGKTLVVAGVGPDEPWIRGYLEERGDVQFIIRGDPAIRPLFDKAHVAVAVGVTALECVARGCITVAPLQVEGGGIAHVAVSEDTFVAAQRDNFHGFEKVIPTPEAWRMIDQVDDAARAALTDVARRRTSAGTALDSVISASRSRPTGLPATGLSLALARLLGDIENEWGTLRAWNVEVAEARDWWSVRALELQGLLDQREGSRGS